MTARRIPAVNASRFGVPIVIAAIAIVAYANALANGYAFDDEHVILRNDFVHHISGVWRAFVAPYWPNGGGQYRPLVISSYSAEWALWGGRALGYHAMNLAWHAAASVLVYFFARRWLSLAGAAIAAVLFAVHPVHVEAVANGVGRAELMAAAAVLAMLLLHARRSWWGVAAFAVALASKEHALVAPVLAMLLDLAEARTPRWRLYAAYGVVALAWFGALVAVFRGATFVTVDWVWLAVDAPTRWLTMLGVVTTWARLWFAPFDLSADYSPRVTMVWPDNVTLVIVGAALVAGAMALCTVAWRRERPAAVAIAWIGITTLPIANILVPTGVILAERTQYLPSVGAVLLLGLCIERIGRRVPVAAFALACVIAVAFAWRTWTRTPVWQSTLSLRAATVTTHPEAAWTHIQRARGFAEHGGYRDAMGQYRVAIELFDRSPVAWAEMIETATRLGDLALAASIVDAARPRVGRFYLVLAAESYVAILRGDNSSALAAARGAIAAAPDSARGYLYAARAWIGLNQPDSARWALRHVPPSSALRPAADTLLGVIGVTGR